MKLNIEITFRCECFPNKGSTPNFASNMNSLNAKVAIIEISQLICSANQLTGFYMMATLASNVLREFELID